MQTRFKFLKSLDIDQDVERRLSILLARTVEGNNEIFRTPFAKGEDPSLVLDRWDKVFQSKQSLITKELFDLEESNRSKFGPRSIAVPWEERKEGVLSYFKEEENIDCSPLFTANPVIRKTQVNGNLRPISNDKAILFLKNGTNSGLPFYVKKGIVKERVLENFNEYLMRRDPCVLFTRTQEAKKTRTVWGFPIADTLNEMRYYRPLLERQKKQSWRAAINGPDWVDKHITELITNAVRDGNKLVSIDFSSYDTTVGTCLQMEVFAFIQSLFQSDGRSDIDYIRERFNTIGLVTPDGVMLGSHGVPSGSTFTNEVDSIAQYLIAKSTGQVEDQQMQIQGDDGAYAVADPESFKQTFRDYGLNVNEDKSYISDKHLVYLQNLYSIDYVKNGVIGGIYPTYRALNRIMYQERWDDFEEYGLKGSDFYSIRAISILENCRNHPLFEEIVKFVAKQDKFGLRPTPEGIEKYIKMLQEKSGTEGIVENQYGDAIKGIRSFKTFKILSSL